MRRYCWSRWEFRIAAVVELLSLLACGSGSTALLPTPVVPPTVLLGGFATITPATPLDSLAVAANGARFRFVGRIIQRPGVTTGMFAMTPMTAKVRVTQILSMPRAVTLGGSGLITLVLRDTVGLDSGDVRIFLASGLHFDTSIVLRERGRALYDSASLPLIVSRLALADSVNDLRGLRELFNDASVVMSAHVDSLGAAPPPAPGVPRYAGEHQPEWQRAVVTALEPLAGDTASAHGVFTVYFPGSGDRIFGPPARLVSGQTVILALSPFNGVNPLLRVGLDSARAFLLQDSLHVLPSTEMGRVRNALR
jgi:hypothetical protein